MPAGLPAASPRPSRPAPASWLRTCALFRLRCWWSTRPARERVLSTTAFGYALVLAAIRVALPWLELPAISNALSALGLGLAALALHRLCLRHCRGAVGLAAGALLVLSPLLASTFGLETGL